MPWFIVSNSIIYLEAVFYSKMKKLAPIFFLIGICTCSFGQHLVPKDEGSEVKFAIKNFGLNVTGSFKGLKGTIIFDPANLATAAFNVSVQANTVNTGNGSRDKHLKKEDYFNVASYPELNFTSTKISSNGNGYTLEGTLTIKGKKKNISFPFTAAAISNGYQLKGQFKINRLDFNVGSSSWVLSDELTVSLNIIATKE